MRTIYSRSPFLIVVNEATQVEGKIELFIWKKNETEPTGTASYTLTKSIPSTTQKACVWDVSPYIKERITFDVNIIDGDYDYAFETFDNWCYVRIKRYYKTSGGSFTLLDNTLYNSVYGYTDYLQGASSIPSQNQTFTIGGDTIRTLYTTAVKHTLGESLFGVGQISLLIDYVSTATYDVVYNVVGGSQLYTYNLNSIGGGPIGVSASYYIGVPLPYTSNTETVYDIQLWRNGSLYQTIGKYQLLDTCKYKDSCINYINRYGGVETMTFVGKKADNLEVKRTEYNLMQDLTVTTTNATYNTSLGQTRSFNVNGSKTIKLNTGWVAENFSNNMEDLLLTETALFYNQYTYFQQAAPVQIKSSSLKYQTHLNDKAINYELDIELAYNTINNVI